MLWYPTCGLYGTLPVAINTGRIFMYSYGPPHMAELKQDDQLEQAYISYVAQKTYQRRWTIGKSGERGSGISVLAARYDDDDDDDDDLSRCGSSP